MSKTTRRRNGGRGRDRHISVRGVRRDPPDLRKLSRALIALAVAQAEADAQSQGTTKPGSDRESSDEPKAANG